MDRFSHRESILLGYSPQSLFTDPTPSSPKTTASRNSDVDFNDVFGGPPRRSSVHEIRYSGIEVNGPYEDKTEDESPSCPWPAALNVSEKPVFGEDSSHRKRNANDYFFEDIFKGNESSIYTPRRGYGRERDPFASPTSESRVLSPARPVPPRVEPLLSSYLPSQFSLPARVTKGMDLPAFGSTRDLHPKNNNYNKEGGHHDGLSFSHSPTRFQGEFRTDSKQSYRQSTLSQEIATAHDNETSSTLIHEEIGKEGDKLKKELSGSNIHFHFSIYKWASKGPPFAIPLRQDKEKGKDATSLISKAQMPIETLHKRSDSASACGTSSATVSSKDGSEPSSQAHGINSRESEIREETSVSKDQSATPNRLHGSAKQTPVNNGVFSDSRNEPSSHSGKRKEASANARGSTTKPELRQLRSLFSESDDEGPAADGQIRGDGAKESKTKSTKKSTPVSIAGVKEKNREKQRTALDALNVDKATRQVAENTSVKNPRKSSVKGKVNEFVRMFNQESSPKPEDFVISQGQNLRPNRRSSGEVDRVRESLRQSDKEKVATVTEDPDISLNASHENTVDTTGPAIAKNNQSFQFQNNFLIKELAQEETILSGTHDNDDEVKAIDAKIRQWSNGKEGNIRSLLSTLQYVLWSGSGWKTVPLVDIIEGSAVKKAYQRALLYLHPDKLQQKGAAPHQKYTGQRVFDILQEAWNQFNLLGAV